MGTKVKVDGIAVYASVHKPNQISAAYSVDLVVDEKVEAELTALGLQPARSKTGDFVQHKGFEGKVFRFKRKVQDRKGNTLTPPGVFDSQGNAIGANTLIGNGSKVRLYGNAYSYTTPQGVSGVAGGLNNLQVIPLVEFGGVDKIDGGFTVGANEEESIDVIDNIDPRDVI